jgi:hypothetical protein
MTVTGWIQILLYCVIIVALTPLLGAYMTRVFNGERTFLSPILRPLELAIYKLAGVNEQRKQHAVTYTIGMLLFHVGGLLILYVLMRAQASLPFNPAEQVSFVLLDEDTGLQQVGEADPIKHLRAQAVEHGEADIGAVFGVTRSAEGRQRRDPLFVVPCSSSKAISEITPSMAALIALGSLLTSSGK